MISQHDFSEFCSAFLKVSEISDPWCINGLQVLGRQDIQKVALGVSASRNFYNKWQIGEQMLFCSSRTFWKSGVRQLSSLLAERLRILMKHDMSLFAFHLPLDAHPEVGNNATIARALGATTIQMEDICALAKLSEPLSFHDFQDRCEQVFKRTPVFSESFKKKQCKRLVFVPAGVQNMRNSVSPGADVFSPEKFLNITITILPNFRFRFVLLVTTPPKHLAFKRCFPFSATIFFCTFFLFPESCPV